MRIVIQRVKKATVEIGGAVKSSIGNGLLVLIGIEEDDTKQDAEWLWAKVINLRIFDDEQGVMNRSVVDTAGEIMVVSQFTLHASTKKGNRPSYIRAARPEQAIPLYEYFCSLFENSTEKPIGTGVFGADMQVTLINNGPVTIIIDSKNKE